MVDVVFVFAFFSFLVFILVLMNLTGLSVLKVNIPTFVIAAILIFSYIGILPLYFGWDDVISASSVRRLLIDKDFESIRAIVPDSTYYYLLDKYSD